jgi:hypothetical protein
MEIKKNYTNYYIANKVLKESYRSNDPNGLKIIEKQSHKFGELFQDIFDVNFKPDSHINRTDIPYVIGTLIYLEVLQCNLLNKNSSQKKKKLKVSRSTILKRIKTNNWNKFDIDDFKAFFSVYDEYKGWSKNMESFLAIHDKTLNSFVKYYKENGVCESFSVNRDLNGLL